MKSQQLSGHALLGVKAFEMLPDWEKKLYKPDMSRQALEKPWMPEGISTIGEKVGCYCSILDWVYYDEFSRYTRLKDGSWVPHGLPDGNYKLSIFSGKPHSYRASADLLAMMLANMIKALRAGQWEKAVKYGGVLGHHIQEPFTPGHSVPNNLFYELFPDPDPRRHAYLHGAFDKASGNFELLPARLMGKSPDEAVYRIQIEIDRGIAC